jgi:hypothetical protein
MTETQTPSTTRDYLLAALAGIEDEAVSFDDGQYMDWSSKDGSRINVECTDADGNTAQLMLTRNDLESLQRALTAYLLNN